MLSVAHRAPRRLRQPNYSADDGYSAPPGRGAPEDARRLWNEVYASAEKYYAGQKAPDPRTIASNTAWKAVMLHWNKGWTGKLTKKNPDTNGLEIGKTKDGDPVYLTDAAEPVGDPGGVTWLGKLVEVTWITGDGNLLVQRFTGDNLPDLAWDKELRTLMSFPTADVPEYCDPDLSGLRSEVKMLAVWAQGRKAKCKVRVPLPNVSVVPMGVADTMVYRSDKFAGKRNPHPNLEGSQEYVHQFDDGVFIEEPTRRGPNGVPTAILVSGGRLDVKPGGIVH